MTLPYTVEHVDEGVQRSISAVERAISDESLVRWMATEARTYVLSRMKSRFQSEGDKVSGKWAPLAESTIRQRLAQGYSEGPILHRSGAMEQFLTTSAVIAPFPGGVVMDAPGATNNPSLLQKIQTAQQGNSKTPARPVVGMDIEDAVTLTELLGITLSQQIRGGI